MRRVLVIGCSGSGKSTLAKVLAARTQLPLISLDAEFWRPRWQTTPREEWRRRVGELAARDAWIMDGTFDGSLDLRLPRADTLVWFQLPRRVCLWRIVKRVGGSYGSVRPEMAPGCPERIDLGFLHYVWNFERRQTPRIKSMLDRHGGHIEPVIIRRAAEGEQFLDSLVASSRADS